MSLNVELLESSFILVTEREPNLAKHFYDRLFERYPQSKPLFGNDSRLNQERMLTDALVAVLEHLEDATWLEETLGDLGKKHQEYKVTAEMYNWVGECLLDTIIDIAGDDWTSDHQLAWTDAYAAITSLMLKGYSSAPTQ